MNKNSFKTLNKILCVLTVVCICLSISAFFTMMTFADESSVPEISSSSVVSVESTPDPIESVPQTPVESSVSSETSSITSSQTTETSSSQPTSSIVSSKEAPVSSKKAVSSSKKSTSSKKATSSKKSSGGNTGRYYYSPPKNQDKIKTIEAFDDSGVTQEQYEKEMENAETNGGRVRNKYYTLGKSALIISSSLAVILGVVLVITNIIYNKKYRPYDDVAALKREKREAKKAKKQRIKQNQKAVAQRVANKKKK